MRYRGEKGEALGIAFPLVMNNSFKPTELCIHCIHETFKL